jgi:hypothetical protein
MPKKAIKALVGIYENKIYSSVDGIRNVIRLLGASNEKVRRLKGESMVNKLQKEGRLVGISLKRNK